MNTTSFTFHGIGARTSVQETINWAKVTASSIVDKEKNVVAIWQQISKQIFTLLQKSTLTTNDLKNNQMIVFANISKIILEISFVCNNYKKNRPAPASFSFIEIFRNSKVQKISC